MARLRLLRIGSGSHLGEALTCAYTPDGAFVLSGGWDGHLRLWEAHSGDQVTAVRVGEKPVSACGVAPDGKQWLSGSMDGLLAWWDATTHRQLSLFMAHTRPISGIVYTSDGRLLATASWDGCVMLRHPGREREGQSLKGHTDIVAGCRFTPDGQRLLSWSYDGSLRLWELAPARHRNSLIGHTDRVTAAAVAPDHRWAASGSRDGVLKLWDLEKEREARSVSLASEVRGCFFLLDGESLAVVDANGRLTLHALPDLAEQDELTLNLPVQCGDLAPTGNRVALACADGRVRVVAVDGTESAPLIVTATQTSRRTATMLQRLFGRSRERRAYACTCPACQQLFEVPDELPGQPAPCPHCNRSLRFNRTARVLQEK